MRRFTIYACGHQRNTSESILVSPRLTLSQEFCEMLKFARQVLSQALEFALKIIQFVPVIIQLKVVPFEMTEPHQLSQQAVGVIRNYGNPNAINL
jgi:hypothetical protein